MPSPFPGMDPYLERPDLWPDVHARLISAFSAQLAPRIRPRYVTRLAARVLIDYIDDPDEIKIVVPDVAIADTASRVDPPPSTTSAAAVVAPSRVVTNRMEYRLPYRQLTLEIQAVADERLVTVIEILSPVNKRQGRGHTQYVRKRQRLLQSDAHLLEIDLLRAGQRLDLDTPLEDAPYYVFLSRGDYRPTCELWAMQLAESLPVVAVPLLGDDPDVPLDLGAALRQIYDVAGYDLSIDYSAEPIPPLTDEQAAWADALLRERGVRPAT